MSILFTLDLPFRADLRDAPPGTYGTAHPTPGNRVKRPEIVTITQDERGKPVYENRWLHWVVSNLVHGTRAKGIDVHHVDHDPWNNSLQNLVLLPREVHMRWHKLCRNAPRCRPGARAVHRWTVRAQLIFASLDAATFRRWRDMALQLPAWLAHDLCVHELEGGAGLPAQLTPEAQRVIRLHRLARQRVEQLRKGMQ